MAAGGFSTAAGETQFEARITLTVIVSCIMAATGGLMFGYDVGISGTYTIILCHMTHEACVYILVTLLIKLALLIAFEQMQVV